MSSSAARQTLTRSQVSIPPADETRAAARDYMAKADLSRDEFAERVGYSHSAIGHFFHGRYSEVAKSDVHIRATIWEFMRRHPIEPTTHSHGRLFETENVRRMRAYFTAAVENGEIGLIYGPPGTQKTFTLEHLIAARNRAGKNDALYVYASVEMTPMVLMKRLGREAGVRIGYHVRERITANVIDAFRTRENKPAIVVDEAQHLTVKSLEALRELHDRAGCGVVLAGSHDLYEKFLQSRAQLEQWLSRIDHKEPLPGLLEGEVREIAARELGNGQPAKLGEKQFAALLDACRVDDVFARGADGRHSPRKYLSIRRLVKVLAQVKASKYRALVKEEVA